MASTWDDEPEPLEGEGEEAAAAGLSSETGAKADTPTAAPGAVVAAAGGERSKKSSKHHPRRESREASAAFDAYLALGPDRSLVKLHQWYVERASQARAQAEAVAAARITPVSSPYQKPYVPSQTTLRDWSVAHHWQVRLDAYDRERREARRRKREEEQDKLNDEQALYGRSQTGVAIKRIADLIRDDKLGGTAAVQLFKYATDLERLARGAATEQVEADISVRFLPKVYRNVDPDEEGSED